MHLYGARVAGERHAVDHHLGTVGIGCLVLIEIKEGMGDFGLLALVGQIELEAGGLAEGHAAQALAVHLDDGVLNLLRALVEDGALLMEEGLALALPRTAGSTATGAIDEAARIAEIPHIDSCLHVVDVVIGEIVEIVVIEHVELVAALQVIDHALHAIDVEVQVAAPVHADGEALGAAIRLCLGVLGCHAEAHSRHESELEHEAHALDVDTHSLGSFILFPGRTLEDAS